MYGSCLHYIPTPLVFAYQYSYIIEHHPRRVLDWGIPSSEFLACHISSFSDWLALIPMYQILVIISRCASGRNFWRLFIPVCEIMLRSTLHFSSCAIAPLIWTSAFSLIDFLERLIGVSAIVALDGKRQNNGAVLADCKLLKVSMIFGVCESRSLSKVK